MLSDDSHKILKDSKYFETVFRDTIQVKVKITKNKYRILKNLILLNDFTSTKIKGKGSMETYWLKGKRNQF